MKFSAQRLRYVPIMKYRIDMADFRGATITGSIPVTEKVLNELANEQVSDRSGRIQQFDIQVGRDNYLQVGVKVKVGPFSKWFRPELVVAPSAQAHRLVLSLASHQYAGLLWIAELFARERLPQGFSVQSGQMVFDFAAMPAIARYVAYLQSLQITTQRGTVFLSFHVRMN